MFNEIMNNWACTATKRWSHDQNNIHLKELGLCYPKIAFLDSEPEAQQAQYPVHMIHALVGNGTNQH